MVSPPADRNPAAQRPAQSLTGLTEEERARPAFEVLSSVCWRGPTPDPAVTRANDFLRAL